MGVIEQLVPFIRFGQLIGILPYSVEIDSMTKKCKNVTFFWCHSITFWCIFVFVLQMLGYLMPTFMALPNMQNEFNSYKMSKTFIIITGILQMNSVFMIFVDRAITFRYRKLQSVIHLITHPAFRALEEMETFPNCKKRIRRRTLIGIFLIVTLVC